MNENWEGWALVVLIVCAVSGCTALMVSAFDEEKRFAHECRERGGVPLMGRSIRACVDRKALK